MPRRVPDGHMHEYDDKWQCKCGYRLIANYDEKSGRVNVKAYVTAKGETVPFGESDGESGSKSEKSVRQTGHKHRSH